jgi:hypothetical protein
MKSSMNADSGIKTFVTPVPVDTSITSKDNAGTRASTRRSNVDHSLSPASLTSSPKASRAEGEGHHHNNDGNMISTRKRTLDESNAVSLRRSRRSL